MQAVGKIGVKEAKAASFLGISNMALKSLVVYEENVLKWNLQDDRPPDHSP